MNVKTARSVGGRRATTHWGASAAVAPPASTSSRTAEAAPMSTSAPPAKTPATTVAPTRTGATSVAAHLDTSGQAKGTWARNSARLSMAVTVVGEYNHHMVSVGVCLCCRHCVSGAGFDGSTDTGVSIGQGGVGDGAGATDENSLSHEACYECKINGYPKKGRSRRSTNSTQEGEPHLSQQQVGQPIPK